MREFLDQLIGNVYHVSSHRSQGFIHSFGMKASIVSSMNSRVFLTSALTPSVVCSF